MHTDIPEDPRHQRLRERLENIQTVCAPGAPPYGLPEAARDVILAFTRLGLRLLGLHRPRDAGGITSDPAHPILRCRSCMWRWPCPTFQVIVEAFDRGRWDRHVTLNPAESRGRQGLGEGQVPPVPESA